MLDLNLNSYKIRNSIVGLYSKVPIINGQLVQYINFDNAATTPPFAFVMNKINEFAPWYSSVHRGTGYKSKFSTEMLQNCRKSVSDFVNADLDNNSIIFVKNTTEAINKLSYLLKNNSQKDIILCTSMEHHSNDLPWRNKFNVIYIDTDVNGRLDLEDFKNKLKKYKERIALVTVTGASNVTGYVNDIYKIAELSHMYNTKILVDGAQLIPHMKFDMGKDNSKHHIDFLAFSAHKMYAPFGCGVLIGPKHFFQNNVSEQVGGGTIKIVTKDEVIFDNPPENQEAGTPNLIGAVALSSAISVLQSIGMENIHLYENSLRNYAILNLQNIDGIELYCDEKIPKNNYDNKNVAIIPFNIKGLYHKQTAKILSDYFGIGVRSGCFCAHPYVAKLLNINEETLNYMLENPDKPKPGMVRLSFGIYNNFREIDVLVNALKYICKNIDKFENYN